MAGFPIAEFDTDLGKITVTEDTIGLKQAAEYFEWGIGSFPVGIWRGYFDGPFKPELFERVTEELIGHDITYLKHPAMTGWIEYNQEEIGLLRTSGVEMGDERIKRIEDRLKTVTASAAIKHAKRDFKRMDSIAAQEFDQRYDEAKPLHEFWWSSRKEYLSEKEHDLYVRENYEPDYTDVFAPDRGVLPGEELDRWIRRWLRFFRRSTERKREDVHLRGAVRMSIEEELPDVNTSNLRRGRRRLRTA